MRGDEPVERRGAVARLIGASARQPLVTLVLVGALTVWGVYALMRTPLDAIPDLSDTQVIIFTEWQGQSPDLVEDQLTYPISTALLSAPRVRFVRGQSFFGLSFVYVVFEDGTDMYWARSRVLEYLSSVESELPEGVHPTLGPDATGVGWVYEYALVDRSGRHDLAELRSIQDWNLRYALESVQGVAEVASVGGFVKQYQVQLDPDRLRAYDVTLDQVVRAVRETNEEVGGRVLEMAGHEYVVRGRAYVKDIADLGSTCVRLGRDNRMPVYLRDVANVALGPDMRRGVAELNGEGEVVGGIVIMRYGENALAVIDRVKARLHELHLPEGVEIVPTYDRSELIEASIGTLEHTLIEEMIVVSVVIFFFLLHVRSALVAVITLPVAVILAFIPMVYQGLTANIMSLGGIAVAIGAMVDASIIIIENVHKRLESWEAEGRPVSRTEAIISAMQEVGPSIFFSLLVITVAFLPVFTLEGAEGRLFRPLALTKTYSMGFGAILAVTLTPALAALLIRGKIKSEDANPLNRVLSRAYAPVVRFVVRHRYWVVFAALVTVVLTVPAYLGLSTEFMPPLNEGVILYMPTAPPGMSMTEATELIQDIDRRLREIPEVGTVFGKMGRARTATDSAPLGMAEVIIVPKPRDQWRPGMTWADLDPGDGRADPDPRHAERVVDADPDPDGDAGDGDPQPPRHPGARRRPRHPRADRDRHRARGLAGPGDAERVRGARHRRLLPRHRHPARRRGALRPARASRSTRWSPAPSAAGACPKPSRGGSATRSTFATRESCGTSRIAWAMCWCPRPPAHRYLSRMSPTSTSPPGLR